MASKLKEITAEVMTRALLDTFADPALFRALLINDRSYLVMYRLHARVCGLLARIGINTGFLVDIGRRHPIDSVPSAGNRRRQHQAEADLTFVDPASDAPLALLDYETGDAPIDKMRSKFRYFNTFLKHTPTVHLVVFLITVAGVQHSWEEERDDEREAFTAKEIPKLVEKFYGGSHNQHATVLIGTFYKDHLEVRQFSKSGIVNTLCAYYPVASLINVTHKEIV